MKREFIKNHISQIDMLIIRLLRNEEDYLKKIFGRMVDNTYIVKRIINKLKSNKLSTKILLPYITYVSRKIARQTYQYILYNCKYEEIWQKQFSSVSRLLQKHNVNHVFIKILSKVPSVLMGDIDVLIYDTVDLWKAAVALSLSGYKLYKLNILLDHPLKIGAYMPGMEPTIPIDLYPELIGNRRKIVGSKEAVFKRKVIGSYKQVEFFMPSPEDTIYITAVHAYSHLEITLAEILQGLNVIKETVHFDWEYLYNSGRFYGTLDALYTYLSLLNILSNAFFNEKIIDESILYKYENIWINLRIRRWLTSLKRLSFPLTIPKYIGCLHSAIYYSLNNVPYMDPRELLYGLMTHVLMYLSD